MEEAGERAPQLRAQAPLAKVLRVILSSHAVHSHVQIQLPLAFSGHCMRRPTQKHVRIVKWIFGGGGRNAELWDQTLTGVRKQLSHDGMKTLCP